MNGLQSHIPQMKELLEDGDYTFNGSKYPARARAHGKPADSDRDVTFRPVLYVKL